MNYRQVKSNCFSQNSGCQKKFLATIFDLFDFFLNNNPNLWIIVVYTR